MKSGNIFCFFCFDISKCHKRKRKRKKNPPNETLKSVNCPHNENSLAERTLYGDNYENVKNVVSNTTNTFSKSTQQHIHGNATQPTIFSFCFSSLRFCAISTYKLKQTSFKNEFFCCSAFC